MKGTLARRLPQALLLLPLVACATLSAQDAPPRKTVRAPIAADAALGGLAAARPGAGKRANKLARERSPYLREHAFDPVAWHPWGEEAFAEAKARDVPLFVSSGYSTCHWCHVMHRESFEDDKIAELLNANFVCVKIEREEMPEVDEDLIRAVQAFTGSAGWPVTVFVGHDRRPFYGGTYFPPERLAQLVANVVELWKDPKERLSLQGDAKKLEEHLAHESETAKKGRSTLDKSLVIGALEAYAKNFDKKWKGFGDAPKFPREPDLDFLLRMRETAGHHMALETLDVILRGGIRDHVGGGFHRYATDPEWRVPHFEKTLYDQALLASALSLAFELTREPRYAQALRETCDYVLRDLRLPGGGFASAEDADSSGEEGRFYTFTRGELDAAVPSLLSEEAARYAAARFGIETLGSGNCGGRSILWLAKSPEAAAPEGTAVATIAALESQSRAALAKLREDRVRPRRDDKVLTGWNGLMVGALAHAGALLGEPRYLDAARATARTIDEKLTAKDGTLHRRMIAGEAKHPGALEDYAYLLRGLVELYEADLDLRWLERALALDETAAKLFWDAEHGAWNARTKGGPGILPGAGGEDGEGALPSPAGVLAFEEQRLAALTGQAAIAKRARAQVEGVSGLLSDQPYAVPSSLAALDRLLAENVEIVVAGPRGEAGERLLAEARKHRFVNHVLAWVDPKDERAVKLLGDLARERGPDASGKPQAFVCKGKACQMPVTEPAELAKLLEDAAK